MYKRSKQTYRHKKIVATLVAIFLLGNILLVSPVFASVSTARMPSEAHSCWPFWPFCTPSPTPTLTATATPAHTATPTPHPTGTPRPHPTPTPSPTPKSPLHLAAASSFTLSATEIVGTNARLTLLPDLLHPVLTFASVTIQGMTITHLSFSLSASGTVTGSGVAIKTSVFQELASALGSFTNKADLLVLLAGGTVHTLTMTHVSLQIDRYIDMQSLTIQGLKLSVR
jgi:hypothetical protein